MIKNPIPNKDNFTTGLSLALDKVHGWIEEFYTLLPNLIVGLLIVLLFLFLAYGLHQAVAGYFSRKDRIDLGHILSDFVYWITVIVGIFVALTIIVPSLRPVDLLASFGVGSLVAGFAFKDILQNWLSGLLILLRLPFRRGDQIRINEAEGTVQRIEPRATIIRTYDGRDIVIPNKTIYTGTVIIHTSQKYRRVEINFTVGYAYKIRHTISIIENSLKNIDEILKDPPPQILCWELGATSLGIKARWWIASERSQEVVSRARAIQAIKESFDANGIDPTDPQLVFYKRIKETPYMPENTSDITETNYGPPPAPKVSHDDPESEKPKIDSKNETMLPEK